VGARRGQWGAKPRLLVVAPAAQSVGTERPEELFRHFDCDMAAAIQEGHGSFEPTAKLVSSGRTQRMGEYRAFVIGADSLATDVREVDAQNDPDAVAKSESEHLGVWCGSRKVGDIRTETSLSKE
jgi:hypothetical protein